MLAFGALELTLAYREYHYRITCWSSDKSRLATDNCTFQKKELKRKVCLPECNLQAKLLIKGETFNILKCYLAMHASRGKSSGRVIWTIHWSSTHKWKSKQTCEILLGNLCLLLGYSGLALQHSEFRRERIFKCNRTEVQIKVQFCPESCSRN